MRIAHLRHNEDACACRAQSVAKALLSRARSGRSALVRPSQACQCLELWPRMVRAPIWLNQAMPEARCAGNSHNYSVHSPHR